LPVSSKAGIRATEIGSLVEFLASTSTTDEPFVDGLTESVRLDADTGGDAKTPKSTKAMITRPNESSSAAAARRKAPAAVRCNDLLGGLNGRPVSGCW
jgi:hypothetical protein